MSLFRVHLLLGKENPVQEEKAWSAVTRIVETGISVNGFSLLSFPSLLMRTGWTGSSCMHWLLSLSQKVKNCKWLWLAREPASEMTGCSGQRHVSHSYATNTSGKRETREQKEGEAHILTSGAVPQWFTLNERLLSATGYSLFARQTNFQLDCCHNKS